MANTKISAETAAAALDGTELYEAVQAAANVKVTGAQIKTLAQSGLATVATSGSATDLGAGTLPAARLPAFTGDITTSIGTVATALGVNVVTFAKFQQVAASSLVGNATGSLANATGITLAGGLAFSGSTLTAAGALTPTSVASTGLIISNSATAGVGYATGAGGAVTQLTSKSTATPAINKMCGQVTMNGAALAATTIVSFVLTNSSITATDIIVLNHVSGGTPGAYTLNARAAAGSATIDVRNNTAGSLSEAIVIGFVVIKGVTA